jgi:hypothetical protein
MVRRRALLRRGSRSAIGRWPAGSDRASELGQHCDDPLGTWRVHGEFVVAAAEVLQDFDSAHMRISRTRDVM